MDTNGLHQLQSKAALQICYFPLSWKNNIKLIFIDMNDNSTR